MRYKFALLAAIVISTTAAKCGDAKPTPESSIWEVVEEWKDAAGAGKTWRTRVPGGWIVKNQSGSTGSSMVFLPDSSHSWVPGK